MPTTTKVFKSNKTQAVRLPKDVAFPSSVTEVVIVVDGANRIISPVDSSWDSWFDGADATDDFVNERRQPTFQKRESLDD